MRPNVNHSGRSLWIVHPSPSGCSSTSTDMSAMSKGARASAKARAAHPGWSQTCEVPDIRDAKVMGTIAGPKRSRQYAQTWPNTIVTQVMRSSRACGHLNGMVQLQGHLKKHALG